MTTAAPIPTMSQAAAGLLRLQLRYAELANFATDKAERLERIDDARLLLQGALEREKAGEYDAEYHGQLLQTLDNLRLRIAAILN